MPLLKRVRGGGQLAFAARFASSRRLRVVEVAGEEECFPFLILGILGLLALLDVIGSKSYHREKRGGVAQANTRNFYLHRECISF